MHLLNELMAEVSRHDTKALSDPGSLPGLVRRLIEWTVALDIDLEVLLEFLKKFIEIVAPVTLSTEPAIARYQISTAVCKQAMDYSEAEASTSGIDFDKVMQIINLLIELMRRFRGGG